MWFVREKENDTTNFGTSMDTARDLFYPPDYRRISRSRTQPRPRNPTPELYRIYQLQDRRFAELLPARGSEMP